VLIYLNKFTDPFYFFLAHFVLLILSGIGTYFSIKKIRRSLKNQRYKIGYIPNIITIFMIISLIFALFNLNYIKTNIYSYKKQNVDQISIMVLNGSNGAQSTLTYTQLFLMQYPNDAESYFLQALAYSQLNQFEQALNAIAKSEELGLTFDRYLAGPRNLLGDLYNYSDFQHFKSNKNIQLLHGPILGNLTANSISIWLRTASEIPVSVRASKFINMSNPITSNNITTNQTSDFTGIINLNGLDSNTKYYYEIILNGSTYQTNLTFTFKTPPVLGDNAEIKLGFGGGAGFNPENERMWNIIKNNHPDLFLLLGDNVYIDYPEIPETQQYCYYRRQSRIEFKNLTSSIPIYAIWDDHDFGTDDCTSSLELENPPWKLDVLKIFKQNWVNPYYGNGSSNPGVFFNFSIVDVDFIMLDCRFYRQNPNTISSPSMLGPKQKTWLFNTLNQSTGTFKILISSVPWVEGAKPGSKDTWDGFKQEREEIFSFIEDHEIEGVILLSADRHRSDAWKISRPNGYPLYEFTSSKLTNEHTHENIATSLFSYNEKCSFGFISINTTKIDPELTYQIINIDNELIHSITLKRSEVNLN
jgi:alkaline phosphatase D